MFNLAQVDIRTLIGLSLLEIQDVVDEDGELNPRAAKFLRSQIQDNFCAVLCAIGYVNMKHLETDLMESVNEYSRRLMECRDR